MSKLYNIVNKVINSNSEIEAEQILFGQDGIILNTKEYYQGIITNFKKTKELVIPKKIINNEIYLSFDLSNCNHMWSILFIYNYYEHYIKERIDECDAKIKELNNDKTINIGIIANLKEIIDLVKENPVSKEKIVECINNINNNVSQLKNVDAGLIENLKNISEAVLTSSNFDNKFLDQIEIINSKIGKDIISPIGNKITEIKNKQNEYQKYKETLNATNVEFTCNLNIDEKVIHKELEKLKRAIVCIHKIRNNFAHVNDEEVSIDSLVLINDQKNKFELSIPISYLDGFSKGRIIAFEKDKIIVDQTDKDIMSILKALNYDIKKIESFFYNVDPYYLNYILRQINYDNSKLYELSYLIFKYPKVTKKFIAYGLDINYVSKLRESAFLNFKNVIRLNNAGIDLLDLSERTEDIVLKFPDNAIKLKEAGIDIENLPYFAFLYPDAVITLYKAGITLAELRVKGFDYPDNAIKLKEVGIDIKSLPYYAFDYKDDYFVLNDYQSGSISPFSTFFEKKEEGIINRKKLSKEVVDYYKKRGIEVSKLPDRIFDIDFRLRNLQKIIDKIGYEQLDSLPVEFFRVNIDMLDEMFMKYNLNISRAILGLSNPKLIATIVYANKVLSSYNKDVNIGSIIWKSLETNAKFRHNFDSLKHNIEVNIDKEEYTLKDVENEYFFNNKPNPAIDDYARFFIRSIRNSVEHFRVKPVKDKNGNVLPDKVYLFDENLNGENNFNIIVDIKDLVEIIRNLEIEMEKTKQDSQNLEDVQQIIEDESISHGGFGR